MSTTEIVPTLEASYPELEIRYFAKDKEAGVKRHYEIRGKLLHKTEDVWCWDDWYEVPSVTTVQDILHKEALIGWAQRIGAGGVVKLVNMKVLQPGRTSGGYEVLCLNDPARGGLVVVDEWEAVELLKANQLAQHQVRDEGGERGESVHAAFEDWCKQGKIPDPSQFPMVEQGYVRALRSFITESGFEPRASEIVVASLEDEWAGRYDADLWLPARRDLWTWRTPKGQGDQQTTFDAGLYKVDVKTGKGVFPEHGEQLEAYEKGSIECGLEETLQRCVIHCGEDGRYMFVPVGSGQPRVKQYAWATYTDFRRTLLKWRAMEARKGRRDGQ